MPRFPAYRSPYDDTPLIDGDSAFRGFASRIQPTALEAGILSYSENMRLEQALAQPRKGALALCTDIRIKIPPLILDFDLAPEIAGVSISFDPTTRIATATLAEPIVILNELDRVNLRSDDAGFPSAYEGDHDMLSISEDKRAFTFIPFDERGEPPENWAGEFIANAGPVLAAIEDDSVRGACVATDRKNREMVVMALIDRAVIYRPGLPTATVAYPHDAILGDEQEVALVQFVDKVYIFRNPDAALVWDMDFGHAFQLVPQGPHYTGEPQLIYQPPADWGVVFNNQLILPFSRNELILSDFGDPDTFDKQYGEVRILTGANDWLVGVHPYQQSRVLIFYRKSVHLATLSQTDLGVDAIYELTRQLGCAARTTIANCGAQILWLSDSGVHALNIGQELNLTAAAAPLSEPIQDIIDRINWTRAGRATAAYYGNRYYLAIPIDGAQRNNAVIIYNFLNGAWETIDTFPTEFDVREFAILDYAGQHRLHAVTTYGYVYLLEQQADGMDDHGISPDFQRTQIRARLLTRAITHGTIEPKRFTLLQIETDMEAGEQLNVAILTRNPDTRRDLLNFTAARTTDHTHRPHLRSRGIAAQVEVITNKGRPKIKGVLMEAASFNNQYTPRE